MLKGLRGFRKLRVEGLGSKHQHRGRVWVVRVGGDDGELRPWHYIYVFSVESRLLMIRLEKSPVLISHNVLKK